tara:strand:+ start:271 stop:684 length:414 start_codon:yes stop_codon:yes gene_type:complete
MPVLATVCSGPPAKRQKGQARSRDTEITVPQNLPDSARKLAALNAPTVRVVLDLLGLSSDGNKKVNVAALSRHLVEFGAVELPRRADATRVDDNPFLCGHRLPPAETHGPGVLCTADVRASAHLDLAPPEQPKVAFI